MGYSKKFSASFFENRQDLLNLFWVILAGSNFISFFGFAYSINSLVNMFSLWEVVSILSYVLSYALLESIFIFIILLSISLLLPRQYFRDQLSRMGTLIYLLGTFFLYPWIGFTSRQGFTHFYFPSNYISQEFLFYLIWVTISGSILYLISKVFRKEANLIKLDHFVKRISVLSILYLTIDIVSSVIVLVRVLL